MADFVGSCYYWGLLELARSGPVGRGGLGGRAWRGGGMSLILLALAAILNTIYLKVSPLVFNWAYFQVSVLKKTVAVRML